MPQIESIPVGRLICGDRAGVGLGYTLEATAVRLAEGIAELRETGGIPQHVRTVTTVLPQLAVLEIRLDGLALDTRSDLARLLRVAGAAFDLASRYNVVALDPSIPPLFTQRILLTGSHDQLLLQLEGAAVGPLTRAAPAVAL